MEELLCYNCKNFLPVQFFSRDSTREYRGRKNNICKACDAAKFRAWYLANREKNILRSRYNKLKRRVLRIGLTESDIEATIDGKSVYRVLYELLQPQMTRQDKIRELLASGIFNQTQVAGIVGVTRQYVSQIAETMILPQQTAPTKVKIPTEADFDRARLAAQGLKRCSGCKDPQPFAQFRASDKDRCKTCIRTYQRNHKRQLKRERDEAKEV